jgi:two-component system, OmpR family, response regulator CpxR
MPRCSRLRGLWHDVPSHRSAIGERGTLPERRFCLAFTSLPVIRKRNYENNQKQICDDSLPVRPMKPKKTILCVDDNEQALSIRKIMLETRGYRVLACNSGEQALEAFRRGGIDLVLTDLIMPGVDGSRLIEEIKSLSPQTPAVLISGRIKIYERETLADVFLSKGMYEPAELLERIRVLLVRKRGPKRPAELRPGALDAEHANVA